MFRQRCCTSLGSFFSSFSCAVSPEASASAAAPARHNYCNFTRPSTVRFGPVGRVCRLPGLREGPGKGSQARSGPCREGTIGWRGSRAPDDPRITAFCNVWAFPAILMTLLLTKTKRGQNPCSLQCLGTSCPPHDTPSDKSKKRPPWPRIIAFCCFGAHPARLMILLLTKARRSPHGSKY